IFCAVATSSRSRAKLMALRLSGRFSVTVAMPLFFSKRTSGMAFFLIFPGLSIACSFWACMTAQSHLSKFRTEPLQIFNSHVASNFAGHAVWRVRLQLGVHQSISARPAQSLHRPYGVLCAGLNRTVQSHR